MKNNEVVYAELVHTRATCLTRTACFLLQAGNSSDWLKVLYSPLAVISRMQIIMSLT